MATDNRIPINNQKLAAELALILSTFRLEGGKIIRISTGKEARPTMNGRGYWHIWAGPRTDRATCHLIWHRVVFALHRGSLAEFIDHIDGDKTNNDITNLRPATRAQNAANRRYPNRPPPKTGHRGVFDLPNGKYGWRAEIGGKRYQRQPFDTASDAKEDREAFKKELTGDYYQRAKKVPTKPRINSRASKTSATKARTAKAHRKRAMPRPSPTSDTAASRAYFAEIRRANPLLAKATNEELRVIIDLMQP